MSVVCLHCTVFDSKSTSLAHVNKHINKVFVVVCCSSFLREGSVESGTFVLADVMTSGFLFSMQYVGYLCT